MLTRSDYMTYYEKTMDDHHMMLGEHETIDDEKVKEQ